MAGPLPRFLVSNLVQASATVLAASSAQSTNPKAWLLDQVRSKTWRSKVGWTVVAGVNDKLDFTEAGNARVATLTAGTYATPTDWASHVQTQMNAAPGAVNTYTVSYSANAATIARASGAAAVVLKFGDGANVNQSCAPDLGYTRTNKSGSTSYTAEAVNYQSRHWLRLDLGSAQAVLAAVLLNHNLAASNNAVRLQGHTSSIVTIEGTWDVDSFLTRYSASASVYISSTSKRYWRLHVDDTQNSAGYFECGIAFIGPYTEISYGFAPGLSLEPAELSGSSVARHGANFYDASYRPYMYDITFRMMAEVDANTVVTTIGDMAPLGKNFLLALDPIVNIEDIKYVYRNGNIKRAHQPTTSRLHNVSFIVRESLA